MLFPPPKLHRYLPAADRLHRHQEQSRLWRL